MTPDATLEITSGGFCYGMKHNCKTGATRELQDPAVSVGAATSPGLSTIAIQGCTFNMKALNGQWNGYQLFRRDSPISTLGSAYGDFYKERKDEPLKYGWFVCHSCVSSPVDELRRLVYHSVEGLEQNSLFTTDENIENGIVSINRYDWGLWQTEGMVNKHGEEPKSPWTISADESDEWDEEEIEALCEFGHALIDYKDCQQEKWSKALSGMHTGGDDDYGRVGLQEGKAKSFLLFDMHPFDELYFWESTRPLGERLGHGLP